MRIHASMHVCMHTCAYACTHASIHASMHASMHAEGMNERPHLHLLSPHQEIAVRVRLAARGENKLLSSACNAYLNTCKCKNRKICIPAVKHTGLRVGVIACICMHTGLWILTACVFVCFFLSVEVFICMYTRRQLHASFCCCMQQNKLAR